MYPGYFYIAALILRYRDFPAFKGGQKSKKAYTYAVFQNFAKILQKRPMFYISMVNNGKPINSY